MEPSNRANLSSSCVLTLSVPSLSTPSSSPRPPPSADWSLEKVRVALNKATSMVATDFAVNENGAVVRLSGDKVAHGVKAFIKSKLVAPEDWKVAIFCGKNPDEAHTAHRVCYGQVAKSDLPFAVLTVNDQRDALAAKMKEIEDDDRRSNGFHRARPSLVRTTSMQTIIPPAASPLTSPSPSPRGDKKHKREKSRASKLDMVMHPQATLRGVQRSFANLLSQTESMRTITHSDTSPRTEQDTIDSHQPELLRRRYKTPVADKLQVLDMTIQQLKSTYALRGIQEGDQVASLIVNLDRLLQDAVRTEKIRSECNREAHSMLSISLQMLGDLPLVYLSREVPVGTPLCIPDSHKRRAPICGKIDLIFYDLNERCYVVADIKTTRVSVAEGEEDNTQIIPEYLFLKRSNILQLQMYAALLEHASAGEINVGYVLLMGFNPARSYTYSTWRIKFEPKFYLASDFTAPEAYSCFYNEVPKNLAGGSGFGSVANSLGSYRPVAPYESRYVVQSGANGIRGPIFTWDELEALLPHRFDLSRNASPATSKR